MAPRRRPPANESAASALPVSRSAQDTDWRDHALTAAALLVLFLALIRCLVPFTSNLYWESDPRQTMQSASAPVTLGASPAADEVEIPTLFFGPTGAAVFDALSLAVAGLALWLHLGAGGRLHLGAIVAALLGIGFCFLHAPSSIEDAFLCGSWIGAISLALATLHLAQRPRQRRWFIAILIALALPLAIDATRFVYLDHAQTIALFKENEQAFLAARGWSEGSPEHQMYMRRMSFVEPTGAFTFSNILGSIAGALTLLAGGVAAGLWRRRQQWKQRWLLPAGVAAVGLWTVYLTGSKGAPVAMVMALMLVALAWWSINHPRWRKTLPLAALALVITAVVIVFVRGMIGPPPTDQGERSLLFRWHYWQAAAKIITSDTGTAIVGTGPSQFSEEYHWAKNPLNPEEIRSAHNVFIDYTTMLGIGGIALSALLLAWLMQAARRVAAISHDDVEALTGSADAAPSLQVEPRDMAWTIVFMIALFAGDFLVRGPAYGTPERFLIWAAGMVGVFFLVAVLVSQHWLDHLGVRLGLLGAAALLLIHGQIEMTFFQASSAPIAWLVIALAASDTESQRQGQEQQQRHRPRLALIVPLFFMLISLSYFLTVTLPIARQQSLLADAQRTARLSDRSWQAFHQTLAQLEAAQNVGPFNAKAYEWQSRLAMELAANLGAQLRGVPQDKIRQQTSQEIHRLTTMALDVHDRARAQGIHSLALLRQEAQMRFFAAEILSRPDYAQQSLALWRQLIAHRPYAWSDRIELADALWRLGSKSEAVEQYRQALRLSDALYLEPTRMMPAAERTRIESRL